jgi:hypothetical protein
VVELQAIHHRLIRRRSESLSPPLRRSVGRDVVGAARTVPCAATADTSIGSTCAASTSANAVMPGSVQTGSRAIWQMGPVQVFDGEASGTAGASDATLFCSCREFRGLCLSG